MDEGLIADPFQVTQGHMNGWVAILRVELNTPVDDAGEGRGDSRIPVAQGERGLSLTLGIGQGEFLRGCAPRLVEGQDLEASDTEGEDVGAFADPVVLKQLGGHVCGGSRHAADAFALFAFAWQAPGEVEIDKDRLPGGFDQDVLWLEIEVQPATGVEVGKAASGAEHDRHGVVAKGFGLFEDQVAEGPAVDQFHGGIDQAMAFT